MLIKDEVLARKEVKVRVAFHLHPDCEVKMNGAERAEICLGEESVRFEVEGEGELVLERSPYFPEFNRSVHRACLIYRCEGESVRVLTRIAWS